MTVILQGICAALLSASLIPLVLVLCRHFGIMDVPRDARRMHCKSVPRGGGIAIVVSFSFLSSLFCWEILLVRCAVGGCLCMFALGLTDDLLCLGPRCKLLFQVLITLGTVRASGLAEGWRLPVAVLWILLLTNAHNFIDGLDGLLAGSAAIEALAIFGILQRSGGMILGVSPLLLAGACLGFWCFNRYPARLFAGDCGSLPVGFLLGLFSFPMLSPSGDGFALLAPFFVFALPLIDLLCAVLRRVLRGKSPFYPDRGHLHHRICDAGIPHPLCVRILQGLTAVSSGIAVLLCHPSTFGLAGFVCFFAAFLLVRIRYFIAQFA